MNKISFCLIILIIGLIFLANCQGNGTTDSNGDGCSTPPANPMPIPTNIVNPDTSYFNQPFTVSWDHVWTGCGGYEFEYRRAAYNTWVVTDVSSGSEVTITIQLPEGTVYDPTSYSLRVRSYWGTGSDEKVYSEYSEIGNIELRIP